MNTSPRKIAVFSDVHANYPALVAFMRDAQQMGVTDYYSLGDVIGYGPLPRACALEVAKLASVRLMGNHEHAALFNETAYWRPHARKAIEWTREALNSDSRSEEIWAGLLDYKLKHEEGKYCFVHASLLDPVNEYLMPEPRDRQEQHSLERNFCALGSKILFTGHTHLASVMTRESEYRFDNTLQRDIGNAEVNLAIHGQAIVGVGSIGQPRDNNPQGCYVLLDPDRCTIRFRRFNYDNDLVARMMEWIDLDGFQSQLGERLRKGV